MWIISDMTTVLILATKVAYKLCASSSLLSLKEVALIVTFAFI